MTDERAELIERRVGDCGCPEEVYLFDGIDLTIHFEPNGDVDAFMDGGDLGEAERTEEGVTPEEGRRAIFAWAASLTATPPAGRAALEQE